MDTITPGGSTYVAGESNARAAVLPVITSLNPTNASHSGGTITLHVLGSGFTPDAVVNFNGIDKRTTYVSPTDVSISGDIQPSDQPGPNAVTVRTRAGVSNPATFTIT